MTDEPPHVAGAVEDDESADDTAEGTVGDRGEGDFDAVEPDLDVDMDDPEALADRLRAEVALRENLSQQIDVLEDVVERQRELLRCTAELARVAAQAGDEGLDPEAVEAVLPSVAAAGSEPGATVETDDRPDADLRGYY